MMTADSRMTMGIHEMWPNESGVSGRAQVSSAAIPAEFNSINTRPALALARGGRPENLTCEYTTAANSTPTASITSVERVTWYGMTAGIDRPSMIRPSSHMPPMKSANTFSRLI
jgi:hypothetical protein